jgi:hypothetical protein
VGILLVGCTPPAFSVSGMAHDLSADDVRECSLDTKRKMTEYLDAARQNCLSD